MNVKREKKRFIEDLKRKIKERIRMEGIENISSILEEFREKYLSEIVKFGIKDPEQSWKPFKGNLIEDLILESIGNFIESNGFSIIKGNLLEKEDRNLDKCLAEVKRSLLVDFGEFGMHLPDVDLVIYDKDKCKAIAIISSKATLRERIAQTGYWSLKLKQSCVTERIKVFFVTLDEDENLNLREPVKKGRAIAEMDTDGTYVIGKSSIEESDRVKKFEKFLKDLEMFIEEVKRWD